MRRLWWIMVLSVIIRNVWKWGSPGNVVSVVTVRQRNLWKPYLLDMTPHHWVLGSRKSAWAPELTLSRNVGHQLPSDTASYRRRTYTSLIQPWEPNNLHIILVISRASRSTQRHPQLLTRWTSSELSPEINLSGLEVYHFPLYSDEVKECLKLYIRSSYRPTFMSWYFVKHRTNFTLHKIQKIANGKEKEEEKYLKGALIVVSL